VAPKCRVSTASETLERLEEKVIFKMGCFSYQNKDWPKTWWIWQLRANKTVKYLLHQRKSIFIAVALSNSYPQQKVM
jgi:hypothetical protein